MEINCRVIHRHDRANCLARICERCFVVPRFREEGARYLLGGRWLCASCLMAVRWESATS